MKEGRQHNLRRGDVDTFGSSGDLSNNTLVDADVFGVVTCSSATYMGEKHVTSPSTSAWGYKFSSV